MRRLIFVVVALLAGACASSAPRPVAAPALQPVATRPILLGINDGPAVPPDVVARYCSYGRDFIVRAPIKSVDDAHAAMDTIASCPHLLSLWLIETDDRALVSRIAAIIDDGPRLPWGVELGNERDLAGDTPAQFGSFVGDARAMLRDAGFGGNILIGAVYTVDDHQPQDFETYLAPARAACPDCLIALHWYGDSSATWRDRVAALGRDVVVTEFGKPACTAGQETEQGAYLETKVHDYRATPRLAGAVVYQRNTAARPCDGSDDSHLAWFGLQTPDGRWRNDAIFSH